MDDLVDEAGIVQDHDAQDWISWCSKALDATLGRTADETDKHAIITDSRTLSRLNELQSAFDLLPLSRLSAQPLYDLLRGFEMDLNFDAKAGRFPIHTEEDLDLYASRVAGTVAELVLELTYHHYYNNKPIYPADQLDKLTQAGREMGKALQCVNIARDIGRDASIHRVYIPTSWLAEVGLTPSEVIKCPRSARVYMMQQKMLDRANHYYSSSRSAIQQLPSDVQAPIRATVESYMEIGRALRQSKDSIPEGGKLQLPLWRRLAVAWSSM